MRRNFLRVGTIPILLLTAMILSGCSNKDSSGPQSLASEEDPQKITDAPELIEQLSGTSLEEVLKKIGLQCSGPDFQAKCSWNEASFTVSKPSDWNKDVQFRNKACDEGFINPQYFIISDNKSWHISTDYHDDTVKLAEALVKEGIDAQMIRYCY